MDLLDRGDALLRSLADDTARLRRAVLWAVAVVTLWSCVLSVLIDSDTSAALVIAPLVAIAGVGATRMSPRGRSVVLALAAGLAVLGSAETPWIAPAATGLLLVALLEDPSRLPWLPLLSALLGSTGSLVLYPYLGSSTPFVAGTAGIALGLLARSSNRVGRLEGEAGALRGQAVWLEQRTALARELHDVVGHHVTAMVVQAEAGLVADPERALVEIGSLGRTALGELDALVVGLRDPDATLAVSAPPRLADIDELLAAPLRAQGVDVRVRLGDELDLDEVRVLTVYRIVQEALTNVARHARAEAVWVEVLRLGDHLRVRVSDDGAGPPPADGRERRGSGLVGIGERVAAWGGFWELTERLGGGAVLDVVLPLATRAP